MKNNISPKFEKDQQIFCSSGKHQGQTATIVKVNNQKLTVKFDSPTYNGTFVNVNHAI